MSNKQWIKRVSEPDIKSKYYTTVAGKGLCSCIQGNASTNKVKNRQTTYSCLPNCVGYAHSRSLEIMKATEPCNEIPTCDAGKWDDVSKWEHGQIPKLGAIAVWEGNTSSTSCGHVAIVEEIYSSGAFLVSESGWSSFYFRTSCIPASKFYGSGLKFKCFLYNPYADRNFEEEKAPTTKEEIGAINYKKYLPKRGWIAKGDNIELVGRIAEFMYRMFPSYTKKAALGNIYGPNIITSISEFQRRIIGTKLPSGAVFNRADADGLIGPKTLEALVVYGFKL